MNKLLLSGFALVTLASSALAQQPPTPAGAPPESVGQPTPPPPPPPAGGPKTPGLGGPQHDPAGPPRDGPREDVGMRGHRPPPPPPSKGAHFRIEDGDTKIDIKCAENEPMKACADLLLQAMDRLQGTAQP